MKILPLLSLTGLALTIIPSFLHLLSGLSEKTTFTLMAVGMILWFAAASPWIVLKKNQLDSSTQDHI